MVLAIAYEEAKKTEYRTEFPGRTGGTTSTRFFGSRDIPDTPLAQINQFEPGYYSGAHYKVTDQFLVIIDGKGALGRHALAPYSVHFMRAYTPFGPLVSDARSGLTFFVMRAHPDTGSQRLPEKRDELMRAPNRQPWQIARSATFPALQAGAQAAGMMLEAIPGMSDEHGLAAYTLRMKPHAKGSAPDPTHGDGQYLVVVKGSLLHDKKVLKAPALVFVYPKDGPFAMHAGPEGVNAIVLNFPRPGTPAPGVRKSAHATSGLKIWQCMLCAFAYDEAAGLPEEDIAPGTRWKDVPENWNCPDCGAAKADFQMIEPGN